MGSASRRGRLSAGGLALVLLLTGCGGAGSGETSCAQQETTVSDTSLSPGESVTVSVTHQWSDCYDTGQVGNPPPMKQVSVWWRQEGVEAKLGTAVPNRNALATIVVQVPVDAKAGAAELQMGTSAAVAVTVTADSWVAIPARV